MRIVYTYDEQEAQHVFEIAKTDILIGRPKGNTLYDFDLSKIDILSNFLT